MAEKNQKKVLEFYSLNQKIKQIQEQLELLNHQITELFVLEESIKDVEKGKKEVFMPLGGGVFINAEIKDTEKLLVNVGGGVFVKKGLKESNMLVREQQEEIRQAMERLDVELKSGIKELKLLQKEISKEEQ